MDFMPFGKYKNTLIQEIPTDYLTWGSLNLSGGIQRQFVEELAKREGKPSPVPRQNPETYQTFDCSRFYQATIEWKGGVKWDGISPPF